MTQAPSTPQGHRLYAIGDIHGRADLLAQLLGMIEINAKNHPNKQKKIIFLGDYVDRGLSSKDVIERLCGGFPHGLEPIFIRGNHDEMMLDFVAGALEGGRSWMSLGGLTTLASYGVTPPTLFNMDKLEHVHKELVKKIPESHRSFLENTVYSVTYGDYYFVHAGVRPGIPLAKQRPEDQMYIRGDFLFYEKTFGKIIVHGHTIKPKPDVKKNRIGIDTGAFATGELTCLILDGSKRSILRTQP